jgi:hypothetical protein
VWQGDKPELLMPASTIRTPHLVVHSVAVYDDGSAGDSKEQSFALVDGGPVAERIGMHILSRAASLIDAPKVRLKDEGRRCGAVVVTLSISRDERSAP